MEKKESKFANLFKKKKNSKPNELPNQNLQANNLPTNIQTTNETQEVKPNPQPVLPKKNEKLYQLNGKEKMIYKYEPDKESSPIVPIIFFLILISTILILPYISKKVDLKSVIAPPVKEEEPEKDEFFFFGKTSVRAKKGDLEFTNFVKSQMDGEYRITFNIENTAPKTYQFNDKYYIVLYDEKEQVIFRSLIHSFDAIGAYSARVITLNIGKEAYDKSDRFKVEEIPVSTYPEVKLQEKEGEYDVMKCTYHNNIIKYYFKEDKLQKIYDIYQESSINNSNYNNDLIKYKDLSNKYKAVTNFKSDFVESKTDFKMVNDFDLKQIPDSKIRDLRTYRFFRYNESKDVVAFELESQAYSCS